MSAADGAAMRLVAAQVSERAERIGAVIARLDARISQMTFAGPAAERFRAAVADQRAMLEQTRGLLRDASDVLLRGAVAADAVPPGGGP